MIIFKFNRLKNLSNPYSQSMNKVNSDAFFKQAHLPLSSGKDIKNIYTCTQLPPYKKVTNQTIANIFSKIHFKGDIQVSNDRYESTIQDYVVSHNGNKIVCFYDKIMKHKNRKKSWDYSQPHHLWRKVVYVDPELFLSLGFDYTHSYIPRPSILKIFSHRGIVTSTIHHERLTDQICVIDRVIFGLLSSGKIQTWDFAGKPLELLPSLDPGRHPSRLVGSNGYLHHCFGSTIITYDLKNEKRRKIYRLFEDLSLSISCTSLAEKNGLLAISFLNSFDSIHPTFILNPYLETIQKCFLNRNEYVESALISDKKMYLGSSKGLLYYMHFWKSESLLTAIEFGSHPDPITFMEIGEGFLMTGSVNYRTTNGYEVYENLPKTTIKLWNLSDHTLLREFFIPQSISSLKYFCGFIYYHYHSTLGRISFE